MNDILVYKVFLETNTIQKCRAVKLTKDKVYYFKNEKKRSVDRSTSDYITFRHNDGAVAFVKDRIKNKISDLHYEIAELKDKMKSLK